MTQLDRKSVVGSVDTHTHTLAHTQLAIIDERPTHAHMHTHAFNSLSTANCACVPVTTPPHPLPLHLTTPMLVPRYDDDAMLNV